MRWLVLPVLLMIGCTTVVKETGRPVNEPRRPEDGPPVALPTDHAASIDEALGESPCEGRLRDIQAELLIYKNARGKLPSSLADLKPYQVTPHDYACPESKKPYDYYPGERMLVGSVLRVIVADPEPTHAGRRWCIFQQHNTDGMAETLYVQPVAEEEFRKYTPAQ